MTKLSKKLVALFLTVCLALGMGIMGFAANSQADAEPLLGDLDRDGEVTAIDARIALRASARIEDASGLYDPTSMVFWAADVDANGSIEAIDARMILRVSAKIDVFGEVPPYQKPEEPTDPDNPADPAREAIAKTVVDSLNEVSVAEKNKYLSDVVGSVASFMIEKNYVEQDLVNTTADALNGAIATIGEADWRNASEVLAGVLPGILGWASDADIETLSAMIANGATSNQVLRAALDMLVTDDAVNAVLDYLAQHGIASGIKEAVRLLDEAGILEPLYEAGYRVLVANSDDAELIAKLDTYEKALAELNEELDYLARENSALLENADAWLKGKIEGIDRDKAIPALRETLYTILAN